MIVGIYACVVCCASFIGSITSYHNISVLNFESLTDCLNVLSDIVLINCGS